MIILKDLTNKIKDIGYELRYAKINEIDKILSIYKERIDWFRTKNINQWQKYLEHHNKDEFLNVIKKNNLFIICKNNIIIACFEISEESRLWNENTNDSYYVYKLVTKIGTKNVGKLIFDICENLAKTNGKKFLKIDCLAKNKKLNEIYQSYGFELIKTDTKDYYTFNLRSKSL